MGKKYPCISCLKSVYNNQNAVLCHLCKKWIHLKCSSLDNNFFKSDADWICDICLFKELPFNSDDFEETCNFQINDNPNNIHLDKIPTSRILELNRKSFTVAHLNIRSIRGKFDHVKDMLYNNPFDILGLSETWIDDSIQDSELYIGGYNVERNDRNTSGGGVACYINSNLIYNRRKDLEQEDLEILWFEVRLKHSQLYLIAIVYRPPNSSTDFFSKAELQLEKALHFNSNIIVLGDFNCNMLTINPLSSKLKNMCTYLQLKQIISEPTRITNTSRTCIDLILLPLEKNNFNHDVVSMGLSDHSLIFVDVKTQKVHTTPTIKRFRSFRNFDREKFLDEGGLLNWNDIYDTTNIDSKWSIFVNLFVKLCDKHAPIVSVRQRQNPSPWITDDYISLSRERDYLKERFDGKHGNKDKNDMSIWKRFQVARNKLNNWNKKLKKDYYLHQFDINKSNSKNTWKTLREFSPSVNNNRLAIHDTVTDKIETEPFKVANLFNEHFTPQSDDSSSDTSEESHCTFETFKFKYVTEDYVFKELNSLSTKKSPGLDSLHPFLLKEGGAFICEVITHIFNTSLRTGCIPKEWKKARVTPLYKNGSKQEIFNYRPISVLPHIMKILEKAVHSQLYKYFIDNELLSSLQSGFRPLHSTNSVLIDVNEYLLRNIEEGLVTGVVFIDLKSAFDSVSHELLLSKLSTYGVKETEAIWFSNYLHDREQCVKVNDSLSNFRPISKGVPQGSMISPLLFSIFINDACNIKFGNSFKLCVYADDTAIFCRGKSCSLVQKELQLALNKILAWIDDNRLTLNVKKTKCMLIGTQSKVKNKKLEMYVNTNKLEQVNEFKYLGLIIDSCLRWNCHINTLCNKLSRTIGYIRRIQYLLPKRILLMIYNSLFLPHIDYCNIIWGQSAMCHISRIQKLQNRFARLILKADFFTPHITMLTELSWQSVRQRINYQICLNMYKIQNNLTPLYLKPIVIPRKISIYTRHSAQSPLFIKTPRTDYFKRSLHYQGSLMWNNLSPNVRVSVSLLSFKRQCKLLSIQNAL